MHQNLEKRFIELECARGTLAVKLEAFRTRFYLLFAAIADYANITPNELGERMGWGPVPDGGNAIMCGKADPSNEDIYRLLDMYLAMDKPKRVDDVPRCERCGWALAKTFEEGCTEHNCCMRPQPQKETIR